MVNKETKEMEFVKFKEYGNDLTFKVLSRTEKTVTIETIAWGISRVKIRKNPNGVEYISFKAWLIYANDLLDVEEAKKISYEQAYY